MQKILVFLSLLIPLVAGAQVSSTPSPSPSPTAKTSAQKPPSIVSVTRVVGEVGDRVVTSREVRINDAVSQAINGKAPTPEGFRILHGHEKTFSSEVAHYLDEWAIYLEAKALSTGDSISKAEIAKAMKAVQDQWRNKSGWEGMEVGEAELREMVERKLIAQEFERLKSDPQLAPVSDEDALSYYRKNRLRFGNLPYETFKDNIKAFLTKSQTDRRLAEWRDVLRRKYKVRNFISG